jgi:HTH-type transcriptional regulator/antitoxin HipB
VIEVSSPDIFPNGTRLRTPGNIGNLVQAYRLKAKLTQQDLAELVKVSRQWIVAVEKGKARAEIGLVLQVLNTLDIPIWAK